VVNRNRVPFRWLSLVIPGPAAAAALATLVTLQVGALAVPAAAGVVVVPLASQLSIGGAVYSTKVWVSNPDSAPRHFNTLFVPQGVDGTAQKSTGGDVTVPPSRTVVLTGVAPAGQSGLLEISGAGSLVVAARLEITNADGSPLGGATIPAISQDDALAAGAVVELQGLQRGTSPGAQIATITDFSLINLDGKAAQCSVAAIRADGSLLAPPATLSILPLSRRDFNDALLILGSTAIADARIVATCDHAFYAFASVYQPGGGVMQLVYPSPGLSGTVGPGFPGGGPGPGGNNVTFSVPGTFLNATASNSEQLYNLPLQPGVPFKQATIEWDLHIGVFPSGLFTGVMSFRRPNNTRSLREPFCAVQIVNRNSKTLLDLGVENVFVRTPGPWQQNGSYHMKLTYDLTVNKCQLDVSQGGAVIYTIAGPTQWFDMSANDNPLVVDFGQTGIGDGAYYPPVSWSFSNLNVVMVPK
jgi:hypothetical protein